MQGFLFVLDICSITGMSIDLISLCSKHMFTSDLYTVPVPQLTPRILDAYQNVAQLSLTDAVMRFLQIWQALLTLVSHTSLSGPFTVYFQAFSEFINLILFGHNMVSEISNFHSFTNFLLLHKM